MVKTFPMEGVGDTAEARLGFREKLGKTGLVFHLAIESIG
jgi:hypothetical protein